MRRLADSIKLLLGFVLILAALATPLFAGWVAAVPEIDSGMVGSAIALLAGGYLVVVSRARRK